MKNNIWKIIAISCLGVSALNAQESVNTSGGNASGTGGSASYSVGQTFCTASNSTNCLVTQGVQQPYEIMVLTAIDDAKNISLTFFAYPNPTSDWLNLKIEDFELSNLSFHLLDMQGKLLHSGKITEKLTTISLKTIVPGIYLVKVMQNNREIKKFKLIKN